MKSNKYHFLKTVLLGKEWGGGIDQKRKRERKLMDMDNSLVLAGESEEEGSGRVHGGDK